MYELGKGVTQNDAEAVGWYRLAADQSYARAHYNLGRMHEYGKGVALDQVQSLKWYKLASAGGDAEAESQVKRLEAELNSAQIADAEGRADEWREVHKKS